MKNKLKITTLLSPILRASISKSKMDFKDNKDNTGNMDITGNTCRDNKGSTDIATRDNKYNTINNHNTNKVKDKFHTINIKHHFTSKTIKNILRGDIIKEEEQTKGIKGIIKEIIRDIMVITTRTTREGIGGLTKEQILMRKVPTNIL